MDSLQFYASGLAVLTVAYNQYIDTSYMSTLPSVCMSFFTHFLPILKNFQTPENCYSCNIHFMAFKTVYCKNDSVLYIKLAFLWEIEICGDKFLELSLSICSFRLLLSFWPGIFCISP